MDEAVEVFIAYAREDERYRKALQTHIAGLQQQKVIKAWHDRMILAGSDWSGVIDEHLNSADLILLLVSPDFLASSYCYELEMRRALERHEEGKACVVPVILRPVDWDTQPFAKLQALPRDARPVTTWKNRDEAYADITRGIRSLAGRRGGTPGTSLAHLRDGLATAGTTTNRTDDHATEPQVDIELTITRQFDEFTNQDRDRVLAAIGNLLDTGRAFRVVCLRPGSVKLTLRMSHADAEKLKAAIARGELTDLGIVGAVIHPAAPVQPVRLELETESAVQSSYHSPPLVASAGIRGSMVETSLSLLRWLQQGSMNTDAWASFIALYQDPILRYCRARGLQQADAEDVTQGVLARVSQRISHYNYDPGRGSFRSWLNLVVRISLIEHVRSQKLHGVGSGSNEVVQLLERLEVPDDAAEELGLDHRYGLVMLAAENVRRRMSKLSWDAFWMYSMEGKSARAISEIQGISIGTVHQAIYRSRNVLLRELARLEGEDTAGTSETGPFR